MSDVSSMRSKPAVPSGERRQVTVMFADMVGFTAASERLGEEGTYALIQPIYELMAAAVADQGGSVKDFTGDGIMALFGAPVALEDGPLRACRAALSIHERLAARASAIEADHGVRPQMRIGINTGLAVITQVQTESSGVTALGDTVNLASRLQTIAEPGTAVLSEATHRLVQGLVETRFAGEHVIKGKTEPQKVYRLDAVRQGASRFTAALGSGLSTYVGRERELDILQEALAKARAGLQVVDIVAEPGMGKSRLLHEFLRQVDRDTIAVLRGNCAPDGVQTGFGLFIDIIRSSSRLASGDDEAEIGRKLTDTLSTLGFDTEENHGLLLNLLGLKARTDALKGLDGAIIGVRTRELLQALLIARCGRSPTIMVLEDLHWIDSASEELLGKIIAAGSALPLLVLHTRRPEYRPPWIDARSHATLSLERLSAGETEQLVKNRIGTASLPGNLARLVMDRADGNALFAEEIATYLVERGAVRREGAEIAFDESVAASTLPPSVQSLLAARVDTLEADDRALLQAASVAGRSFDADLLARVANNPGDLDRRLEAISALDFLSLDARTGEYVFKHALVRDALYESLLSGPRADLHLRVAEEIERRSDNRLAEVAETLAHHFGKTTETAKAFAYLTMAGRKSLGSYALSEAGTHFRQAEAVLDRTPLCATDDDFANFLTGYVLFLQLANEPKWVVETAEKYRSRTQQLGDRIEVVVASHYVVWALIWMLRFQDALAVHTVTSQIASRLNTDVSFAYSEANFFFLDAILHTTWVDLSARAERAIGTASRTGDTYITAWVRFSVGWNAFHYGHMDAAHAMAADLARTGVEMRDPRSTGLALWLQSWAAIASDDHDDALRYAEQGIAAAITPFDRANSQNARGSTLIPLRRVEEGMEILTEMRAVAAAHGRMYENKGNDLPYGVGLVLQGRFAEGIRHIETSILELEGEGYQSVAWWYRLSLCRLYLDMLYGTEKPPVSVLLRNLRFLVGLKMTGRRKVLGMLRQCEASPLVDYTNFHTGNFHCVFGQWYLNGKDNENAKLQFLKAKSVLQKYGESNLLRTVDQALVRLGAASELP